MVGSQGTMYSVEWTGSDWHLLPKEKFQDVSPPAPSVRRTSGHHAEWIEACKGGPPALCNFVDFAAPLTEVMLLGNLAIRLGKTIEWNAAEMKVTGNPRGGSVHSPRIPQGLGNGLTGFPPTRMTHRAMEAGNA